MSAKENPKIIVAITSCGANWSGLTCPKTGRMHGLDIDQHLYNVQDWMDDPVGRLPGKPGTDPNIRDAILDTTGMSDKINECVREILTVITPADEDGGFIFHFAFQCKGGFQRSSVVAEEVAARLEKALGNRAGKYKIIVHHMTMDLALAVKRALGKAD